MLVYVVKCLKMHKNVKQFDLCWRKWENVGFSFLESAYLEIKLIKLNVWAAMASVWHDMIY